MKNLLLLLILIIPVAVFSQESSSDDLQELSDKIAPGFCACMEKHNFLEAKEDFGQCFTMILAQYEDEFFRYYPINGNAKGESDTDKLVFDLLAGMQKNLFDDCDAYYQMVKAIKEKGIEEIRGYYNQKSLDSLNEVSASGKDANFYFKKGKLLYANNQLQEAEASLKKGLEKDNTNIQYKLLLAWLFEEQGDEAGALKVHDELIAQTGGMEYIMLKEFTRRNFRVVEKKKPECRRFQTGEFRIFDKQTGKFSSIRRTKDLQIETSSRDSSTTKMSIIWIDDCNYVLTYIESTSPEMDDYIGKKLGVEILETNGDTYKFKASMEGVDFIMFDEIQKVE